jgi:hypothetical protein
LIKNPSWLLKPERLILFVGINLMKKEQASQQKKQTPFAL